MAAALPLYAELPTTFLPYGFLAAFGATGIADNYSGCSEYANDLSVIVDEDGNYYGRFSVANSLGIQIPIFENTSPSPSYCAPDLKVSANTVYLAATGSVVILPASQQIAAGDFDTVKRRIVKITRVK